MTEAYRRGERCGGLQGWPGASAWARRRFMAGRQKQSYHALSMVKASSESTGPQVSPRVARTRRFLRLQISTLHVVLAASLLMPPGATSSVPASFEIREVAEGVFVHAGVHVSVDDPGHDDIANIGFIVGSRCVAVVDSGGSVATGAALLEAIRSRTSLPVCYVINTHVHYDHVLGNGAFRTSGAKFVGHAGLADAIAGSRAFFMERFAVALGDAPGADAVIGPGMLVEGNMQLDLGDRVLELRAHSPAHTTADLSIYDARTGTLWLGDLLFLERTPALDGSLRGWLDVLTQLEAQPVQRVIPGHGPVSAAWPAAAVDQRRYLEHLLAEVRAAIARGEFMEEAVESAAWGERGNWLLFDDVHRRNVTRAFTELEWE